MMLKHALAAVAAVLVAGCAISPEQQAQWDAQRAEVESTRPVCKSEKQCEAMWSAARDWVNANCEMKIQHYTDSFIETYTSIPPERIWCRVTKQPQPSGEYVVSGEVDCFRNCLRDRMHPLRIDFNRTVSRAGDSFQ